jgi:hypothetical protein
VTVVTPPAVGGVASALEIARADEGDELGAVVVEAAPAR